jgi:hypothetical protein
VQVCMAVQRLITAGQWQPGDQDVLVVFDAGYDLARLAFLLADLPVEVLGRLRSDRVFRLPAPPRPVGAIGRPAKHGGEFCFADPGHGRIPMSSRSPPPAATAQRPRQPGIGCIRG